MNYDEIEKSLRLIIPDGQVTELRAIGRGETKYTESGYYTDLRKMAEKACEITEFATGVFFTPNPIQTKLLERCPNHTQLSPKQTTADSDILERRWLLIDCDPARPSGVSATDTEKAPALEKARDIRTCLTAEGWPQPIFADSGNGAHLMYRINLPAKDDGLVSKALEALDFLFSDEKVKIDTGVANPARIWKLYGTWARKGENTAERPHRLSKVIWDETPAELSAVSFEQLETLAALCPKKGGDEVESSGFNLQAWIDKHNLDVIGPKEWNKGKMWVLKTCPWNEQHTNRSAYIVQFANGGIAAGCHHEGCKDHNWQSLRKLYEPDYEPRPRNRALTDYGNAERLVDQHGDNIRYSLQQQRWLVWDGKCWREDTSGEICRLAKSTVRSMYKEASQVKNDDARVKIANWAVNSESEKHINSMIKLAMSEPGVPIEMNDLDSNPYLLNCQNGTLDLKTGKLLPFSREDYITKIIPAGWKGLDHTSSLWDGALNDWTGCDSAMKDFLQRAVGYSITGDTSEEKLFFIYGPTATGKSTFIEAVKKMLGDYTRTADFEAFLKRPSSGGPRNDIARLAGARIVISIEVDKGQKLAEGLVKTITGSDTITSRFLYHESFEFKPTFALWLVANDSPYVNADDNAMWRRIIRVPFDRSIPKEDRQKDLKQRLAEADVLSAILTWAVQGCLKWQKEGLKIPEKVIASTEAYQAEVDPFSAFFAEHCVFDSKQPRDWISTERILAAYQDWASRNGETPLYSHRPLTERLQKIGCKPLTKRETPRDRLQRGWQGIRFS